jgi:type IV pilus assembly protein PilM
MWDFAWRKGAALGIDIGSGAVKLLQLRRDRRGYRVEHCALWRLPAGAVREQRIVDGAAVGAALQAARRELASPRLPRRAVVAVPGSAVITRQLEFDAALNDAELELHVALEAERHIPFAPGEIALDFTRLDASGPAATVLLAACRKEHVAERVAALRGGGFEAMAVEIATQAVERAFALLGDTAGLVALADFGFGCFTLYVLRDGVVIHQREQAAVDTSCGVVESAFRERAAQLGRALQVFYSSSASHEVDRIVLAGGGARPAFAAVVETALQVPVALADPFAAMSRGAAVKARLEQEGPAWFLAAGLALRGLRDA